MVLVFYLATATITVAVGGDGDIALTVEPP